MYVIHRMSYVLVGTTYISMYERNSKVAGDNKVSKVVSVRTKNVQVIQLCIPNLWIKE